MTARSKRRLCKVFIRAALNQKINRIFEVTVQHSARFESFSRIFKRYSEDILSLSRLDDAIIVNTCAVTGEAVRQAAQTVRRLRRERPDARIIVTGCAAQIDPERFADMPEVDHVVGNTEKMKSVWRTLRKCS